MVATRDEAVAAYKQGVSDIGGPSAYYACGEKGKVGEIAACLHGLKKAHGTLDDWAKKYAARY